LRGEERVIFCPGPEGALVVVTKGLEYRRRSHEILESMDGGKYDVREADEIRDLGEYDTLLFKTASAAGSSFLAGTILGAITAAWQDVPAVERNVALPALKKTGRIMMNYGLTFGAIGGIFAVTEAVAGSIRGENDFWNSALGGAAAGSVLGIRGEACC
jgi:import inner membrane translocase subunit TIM22